MHIPRRLQALTLALCVGSALILTTSCTEKKADATRAAKQGALPTVLVELPGEPNAVAYMRSPAQLATKWVERMGRKLPAGDPLRTFLDKTLAGPVAGSVDVLGGLEGTTTIGLYNREGMDPSMLLRVKGGRADMLDRWVEYLVPVEPTGSGRLGEVVLRKVMLEGDAWFFGEVRGDWYFCNDLKLLEPRKSRKRNMLLPVLEECWNLAVGDEVPDVFIAAELPRVDSKSDTGRVVKALGLDRADFLVYVFEDSDKRFIDSLFLHSPAPHRGLLALADGETVAPEVIREIAEEAVSFGYMPMNLSRLWKDVQEVLPPQVGMMIAQSEQRMDVSLQKDLLDSLGTGWVWNRFPHSTSPNGVATVARVPIRNDLRLQKCLGKLGASMSMDLQWKDGPKGYRLLTLPMGGAIAARRDHWYVGPSEDAMRVWLSDVIHRGGHTAPKNLFQRFSKKATWLAWVSEAALRADASTEVDMGQLMSAVPQLNSPVLANLPVSDWQSKAPQMFGDLIMAVIPNAKGVKAQFESDCGLFPWTFVSVLTMAEIQRDERENGELRELRAQIAAAQKQFQGLEGRYARSLWELGDAELIDAQTASGIRNGHLYRIVSDGKRWDLEFKNEQDKAVFMVGTSASEQ
ncbi:MAG: hypothetical protein AAF581_09570 [Planctomycetota bacterium]